jgi:PAS domain S-box-containing protein
MVTSAEQIQIFYEISMSIGASLDLRKMVKTALSTYLKKLNCAAGAVLKLTEENNGKFKYQKIYSIPRNIETIKNYKEACNNCSFSGNKEDYSEFLNILPNSFSHSDGQSSLIMNLPDFGILYLSTRQQNFDDYIVNSIIQLNDKFAQACISCVQNEALQKSEEKFRRIFEESRDIIFISSKEGRFLDINPAGLHLFGYSSLNEIMKIDISKDLIKNPADRLEYQKRIKENGFVKDYELLLKKKDGSEIMVLETSTAVYDAEKNIITYRGIMRDITEKKIMESQLAQSHKMESIGTLAGGVAHDFNNLLTVINGFAEMALINLDAGNPLHKKITSILKAGKRAEKLTSQLLAFSRKQIYKPEILDINQVIYSIDKILIRLIDEDIKIETVFAENLPDIKADNSQLEQILINLVVNARDALRAVKKPVFQKKITIETGQVYPDTDDISKHPDIREGQHIFFAVSDNGIGMDKQTKEKVFEPFFTTKEQGKGTGLGLSMVYGIVKQNNGSINVYSEPNEGTMFKIYWPVTEEKSKAEEVAAPDEFLNGNETLLIVEDEEEVCRFASDALTSLGYKVYIAENGRLAFEQITNESLKIDLIVTDLIMPELNGKEFIEKVHDFYPEIKVIYVSGYTDNHIVHNGLLEEGVNFIHKPYSVKALASTVRRVLDEK